MNCSGSQGAARAGRHSSHKAQAVFAQREDLVADVSLESRGEAASDIARGETAVKR